MNRQLELNGVIEDMQGVQPVRSGFRQTVFLKEPNENKPQWDQYYTIQIFSTDQTDRRFKHPADKGKPARCLCYFKGQRWQGERGFQYNNKLELINWI